MEENRKAFVWHCHRGTGVRREFSQSTVRGVRWRFALVPVWKSTRQLHKSGTSCPSGCRVQGTSTGQEEYASLKRRRGLYQEVFVRFVGLFLENERIYWCLVFCFCSVLMCTQLAGCTSLLSSCSSILWRREKVPCVRFLLYQDIRDNSKIAV